MSNSGPLSLLVVTDRQWVVLFSRLEILVIATVSYCPRNPPLDEEGRSFDAFLISGIIHSFLQDVHGLITSH